MEGSPIKPVTKEELSKTEQNVEQFSLSKQEKNISEVFKLNPQLVNTVYEALGFVDFSVSEKSGYITLYRAEGEIVDRDKLLSFQKGNAGTWFSPDQKELLRYVAMAKDRKAYKIDIPKSLYDGLNNIAKSNIEMSKGEVQLPIELADKKEILTGENENVINKNNFKSWIISNRIKSGEITESQIQQAEILYSKYIESIFPDSKIKDIVWHGTTDKQEVIDNSFDEKRKSKEYEYSHGAIFATSSIEDAETAGTGKGKYDVIPLVINVKNLGISREGKINKENTDNLPFSSEDEINKTIQENKENWNQLGWKYKILPNNILQLTKPQEFKHHGIWNENNDLILDLSDNMGFIGQLKEADINILKNSGLDGIIAVDEHDLFGKQKVGNKSWYVVFESKNTHILGSQKDIEQFKEFISKSENKKDRQSIEEFLKESGIEKVPNIETHFFFNSHATSEDGQMVANRLDDKDIFIQENAGWDKERLETWHKISSGEFTPEQAIENEEERGKPFFWPEYFKAIFEKLQGTNKEILLVDIKSDSEIYNEIYDLMRKDGIYWNILDRSKSFEENCERIADVSELESITQKERENEILDNMKTSLLELLKEKPELQVKENLKILFSMGAFHTRLYHEMKKSGDNVSRDIPSSSYTFNPRMAVERIIHFKGNEKAKEYMPKILLSFLLQRLNMKYNDISQKVLSRFSDEKTRELFEMYKKSESDDQFRNEAQSWIVEQFKKK